MLSQAKAAHLFGYPSPLNSNKGNSWSSIRARGCAGEARVEGLATRLSSSRSVISDEIKKPWTAAERQKKQPSHTHSRFLFLSSSLFSHFTCSFHLESIVSKAHSPGAAPVLCRCQRGKVIKDNVTHDARIWKKLEKKKCAIWSAEGGVL